MLIACAIGVFVLVAYNFRHNIHRVGRHLYYGRGVPENKELGMVFLYIASFLGHDESPYIIASNYGVGATVEKDYKKAVEWCRKSAERDNKYAQYRLAECYECDSMGAYRDYEQAFRWMHSSAVQGYPKAQYRLHFYYIKGRGVEPDTIAASYWLETAAKNGYEPAKKELKKWDEGI